MSLPLSFIPRHLPRARSRGDGRADIVWRQDGGQLATWMMNGDRFAWEPPVTWIPTGWTLAGTLVPR